MIKKIIKKIVPNKIIKTIKQLKSEIKIVFRQSKFMRYKIDKNFGDMNSADIFDKIYSDKIWGGDFDGNSISGAGSHSEDVVKPYVDKVSNFLLKIQPSVIVDLGCGDFNIGKNFVDYAEEYIACDVSNKILNRNKKNFSSIKNVEFKLIDLANDDLPIGDVCLVRQVLQHLSNSDINNFVKKLNLEKLYKYLIITEHIPINKNFKANLDKRTGSGIRLLFNSGVVLHKEPFNLIASETIDLVEVPNMGGIIKTIIYKIY
jgi:hypothetical protein